ncbi:ATP-binding protein [Xanthobacter autotrophicus]|uniref:ATP-binding protein n=1 Tax=Xanthobacter TaxID=279 RepID=UPI001AC397EE|nr:ATP-binding protein [Hyphomicrobiales bacterium]
MPLDAWLPIGFDIAGRAKAGSVLLSGKDWQIVKADGEDRLLLMRGELLRGWLGNRLLDEADVLRIRFGSNEMGAILNEPSFSLAPLDQCASPRNKVEALSFATSLRETRVRYPDGSLGHGLYVEKLSRILPACTEDALLVDELVLGSWLTGGLRVSVNPMSGIQNLLSWMSVEQLADVIRAAGLEPTGAIPVPSSGMDDVSIARSEGNGGTEGRFRLPGRSALENFFNDHVVDIVHNRSHYAALGIENPGAIVLEGPAGCGKTVAVERLIAHLGWPYFAVDAESVASPFIHETSRKVGQLFQAAIAAAPSVIVIDEMDAFLSERDAGGGQHRIEEIAEFLRAIPEAIKAGVLVVGMTNRVDMIDPAVLRRGRFDHIVKVDYAEKTEMLDLLRTLLEGVPLTEDVTLEVYASRLAGRPLSDTAFVVREAARRAARARMDKIDDTCFANAINALPQSGEPPKPRVGFL